MKSTIESLMAKTGSGYVRALSAATVLVPLAAVMGGFKLSNHNETVVRDASDGRATKEATMKSTIESPKVKTGYVRAVSAVAVLVPLAAVVGGLNLGNHNETVVRDVR